MSVCLFVCLSVCLFVCLFSSWSDGAVMTSDGLCRYGNSVECCWGWKPMDRGRCQPDCQQGCKHGDCVGPDRCKCHPGYTGKACNHGNQRLHAFVHPASVDSSHLNECGVKPRPCKHRCMNTVGSYKCYCLDGFTLMEDGSCRNARTCYHANCQYGCEVIKGAVRCTCPSPGLRLGPDGRTCIDVDECSSGRFVCARRRKCVNTFGSYTCRCHLGFRLMFIDGRYSCISEAHIIFKLKLLFYYPDVYSTSVTTATTTTTSPVTTTTTATPVTTIAITTTPVTTTTTTTTPVTTTTTTPTTPPPATTTSMSIPTTLVTTTELDTTTPTIPPPPTITPVTTTTTTTTTTTSTTTPSTTPPPTTTMVTTVAPVTTTISNKINNDVTHKQRGDVHSESINLCRFLADVGVLRCSFDGGVCGWMSDGDGDLDWETVNNPAGERYLSVPELKAGQRSIRGARLAVQITPTWRHGELCFSFSHWLTGHHVGVLQLFIRKTGQDRRYGSALWSRTGGHGWRHTQVTLTTVCDVTGDTCLCAGVAEGRAPDWTKRSDRH
uniref:Nephronectin a n=1 Tax=Acanthochromis polyacanthus TaxID=80966 RepID=A0A3Q1GJ19_9TELE